MCQVPAIFRSKFLKGHQLTYGHLRTDFHNIWYNVFKHIFGASFFLDALVLLPFINKAINFWYFYSLFNQLIFNFDTVLCTDILSLNNSINYKITSYGVGIEIGIGIGIWIWHVDTFSSQMMSNVSWLLIKMTEMNRALFSIKYLNGITFRKKKCFEKNDSNKKWFVQRSTKIVDNILIILRCFPNISFLATSNLSKI